MNSEEFRCAFVTDIKHFKSITEPSPDCTEPSPDCKDEGYEFVFIEDLIYKENYEIKHDGTQCKIENN